MDDEELELDEFEDNVVFVFSSGVGINEFGCVVAEEFEDEEEDDEELPLFGTFSLFLHLALRF